MDVELRERELASPGPGQVIVKVRACGVCGTDVNFVRDWTGGPMALGHEISAEVVETGPGVTRLAAGDRVIVEDCTMCGTCDACKTGHPERCRTMFSLDGQPGMGEYLLVNHASLVKFSGLDYVPASLTEPLAVSLTSVLNAEIPLGGSVLVLGSGPLGLMSAMLARVQGAGFVAIASRGGTTALQKARRAAADKAGFDLVLGCSGQELTERLKSRFPAGVDRVIVSSPPQSLSDALSVIRFGGRITFYGLHLGGAGVVPVDINDLVFRKITLVPTFAEPAINFPLSLSLLKEGRIDPRIIITQTFSLDQAKEALHGIVEGTLPAVKAVIVP
jgi:threonine dehydrogenase-like Zn-dependent dehydrogenase